MATNTQAPAASQETRTTDPGANGSGFPASAAPETQAPSAAPPSSAGTSGQETDEERARRQNAWFREAFNSVRYGRPPSNGSNGGREPSSEAASGQNGTQEADPPTNGAQIQKVESKDERRVEAPSTVTISQDELNRRVQAETDRRLAKFQQEEANRRRREERKLLREKDPYAFAELDRADEEKAEKAFAEQLGKQQTATSMLSAYDTTVLDPLMRAVPEDERAKILERIDAGIPGRGQAAAAALRYIQAQAREAGLAQARRVLIDDPAFVKEVLAKYGGGRIEPDLVPAAAAQRPPAFSMNDWLRSQGNRVRSR